MFLDKNNIKYITENEIRNNSKDNSKDNSKGNSKDNLTPDFLLKNPVIINKFTVYWIEVKNYVYYGNIILESGIKKQANKYYNKYGSGIFIFKYGVLSPELMKKNINGVNFIGWKIKDM